MSYNFIDGFLEYTQDAESPTSFFTWAAISSLSCIMKDNIYWDTGFDKVYPNIYVLLVAKSGICRKGTPLKVMTGVVNKVGTARVISGRITIQSIVRELGSTQTTASGVMLSGASGLLLAEELSSFFHAEPETIKILTDLYDSHDNWTNSTITGGKQELKDVSLSMLAASNEVLLREVFTSAALYGGLLARTFVIMESRRRHKNSRMQININHLKGCQTLLHEHLHRLSSVKGHVIFSPRAQEVYEEWYQSINDDSYSSKSGVEARIHTGVIKLSMCLAAAEEAFFHDRTVQKHHVELAIDMAVKLLPNYDMLTMGSGKSIISDPMTTIIGCLWKAKNFEMTRKSLLRYNFGDLDVDTLDKCVITMEQSGALCSLAVAGETGYRLTEKFVLELSKRRETPNNNGHIHNNGIVH